MSARAAESTPRAERTREAAVERPRRPAREPEPAAGARGTHDLATLPVYAPRATALWRAAGTGGDATSAGDRGAAVTASAVAAPAHRGAPAIAAPVRSGAPAVAAPSRRGGDSHRVAGGRRHAVQAKRRLSRPRDPCERQADAVAARVAARREPAPLRPAPVSSPRPVTRTGTSARGPPPADVPASVAAVIDRPGPGEPLNTDLRRRIEPHVGAELGHVRVRREPAAARAIGARAFTAGDTIFLGRGESATDVELIAHEATHVVQQQAAAPAVVAPVMRLEVTDVVPEWVIDGVRERVRAIPGYTLLTQIAGVDLITGRPASVSRTELIQQLLAWGPFAAAAGPVLTTLNVVDELFTFISEGLSANRLTLDRLRGDVEEAWSRLSWTEGIDGNLAIVGGYVDRLLGDVRAFVGTIVDRVLQVIRAAVAAVAEPLLQSERIRPVWELAKKVLRYDPLLGREVNATTAEILADFLRLIGQEQRLAQMEERGTLQQTADWIDTQLATFAALTGELGRLFSDAWAAIQPENLAGLLDALPALADRAFGLIGRVAEFAQTVIGKVLELIKDALLGWLSEHAHSVRGFRLVTVIIGQNPFTGERVPRTAENLIGGFITLLPGGEATYQQLSESGVIAEAAGRIESAMSRLGISLELIVGTFRGVWNSLSLDDLLDPLGAFDRIVTQFGDPLSRIFAFIAVVVETVISLVLRLMNFPSDLLASIISNVAQAIDSIQRDPVGFLQNLLEALKLGFTAFFDHILTYLLQGLGAWLFRGLGQLGITLPTDFSPMSILTLVLQVLGLTIDHLWEKLGEHIGAERVAMIRGALDRLGEAWAFISDVQQRGIAAIWDYIASQLGNLWDTLLGMAQEWIMTTIITNVVTRLLSMLDPTGVMAVVNSFVAFFNAIQSAIEYLRDILEIINRYVTTLAQIAAGNITPGAQMLEQGLAAAIPIAIGFLANQVGIGNIPEKVVELIGGLRELIDRALDWLITQALRLGQAALAALSGPGGATGTAQHASEPAPGSVRETARAALQARLPAAQTEADGRRIAAEVLAELRPQGLRRLEITGQHADGSYIFSAEASAFDELVSYLFGRDRSAQGAMITRMSTRIELSGIDEPFTSWPAVPGTSSPVGRPGQQPTLAMISTQEERFGRPQSQPTYGGVVPRPDPAVPGGVSREVFTGTYNTSDDAEACNNRTHAEVQFLRWLNQQTTVFRSRVTRMEVDINYSPCANCTTTLREVRGLVPASAQCTLTYHTVYTRTRCRTTAASLAGLTGWTVTGPAP